jgi:hypothetical protein
MYPLYSVDSDGQKLTGANRYTLHFTNGQLPPQNAFWSLTMYKMPESLLVANPLNRYLIDSAMLPQLTAASLLALQQHAQQIGELRLLAQNCLLVFCSVVTFG